MLARMCQVKNRLVKFVPWVCEHFTREIWKYMTFWFSFKQNGKGFTNQFVVTYCFVKLFHYDLFVCGLTLHTSIFKLHHGVLYILRTDKPANDITSNVGERWHDTSQVAQSHHQSCLSLEKHIFISDLNVLPEVFIDPVFLSTTLWRFVAVASPPVWSNFAISDQNAPLRHIKGNNSF